MTLQEVSEKVGYAPNTILCNFKRVQNKLKEKGLLIEKEKIKGKNNYSLTKIEPQLKEPRFKPNEYYGPYHIKMIRKTNKHAPNTKSYLYIFECPYCKKEFENIITRINNGNTKSCGCLQKKNHLNEKYDNYEVVEELSKRRSGHIVYKCKCKCGNYFEVPSNLLGKTLSCGCLQSKGEALLIKIFQNNNIEYEREKRFDNCLYNGNHLRFDFYLPKYKCLIEYDGSQHFFSQNTPHSWNTTEKLKDTQKRDNFKNSWCKENNIPLIRIPYYEKDLINYDYLLNKIKEACHE